MIKIKYYIVTLLKDLPIVKSGFTFKLSEDILEDRYRHCGIESQIDGIDDYTFTEMLYDVLNYKNNKEWVKIEIDFDKSLKIQCPNCKNIGMFSYFDKELKNEYYSGGVTYWYQGLGLECPCCNYKLQTHSVAVNKNIDW